MENCLSKDLKVNIVHIQWSPRNVSTQNDIYILSIKMFTFMSLYPDMVIFWSSLEMTFSVQCICHVNILFQKMLLFKEKFLLFLSYLVVLLI